MMETVKTKLTRSDLMWAIRKHEAQIVGSQAYLNGLIEPDKSQFQALLDQDQKCIDSMAGDPTVILAETEKFIAEEEVMPLDQNFSGEQADFYFRRRLLVGKHARAGAILTRYQLFVSSD
jgi:hypothetical protein